MWIWFFSISFQKVGKNWKDLIRRLLETKKQYRIKEIEALIQAFSTESLDLISPMTGKKERLKYFEKIY